MSVLDPGPGERELLLRGARMAQDPATLERSAREALDWAAVVFHARLHSVAPLLHANLRITNAYPSLPPDARRRLLALHHRAEYQNRLFAEEHQAIVDSFEHSGIAVLVPKGLSVIELVYRSPTLRPLVDLIYLIPESAVGAATGAMTRCGYVRSARAPVDALYRWSCPELVFEKAGRLHTRVLIQTDLVSWPRLHSFRPAGLWARARPAVVAGRDVLVLGPEDLVLYLCLQADNHGHFNRAALGSIDPRDLLFAPWSNNRLIRFADVHEAITRLDPLDWQLLGARAAASGIANAAFATLTLTNALLGEVAPRPALEQLERDERQRIRRFVFESLAGPDGSGLKRLAGRGWTSRSPSTQIRLARLIGLVEVTFPSPRLLAPGDGQGRMATASRVLGHSARSVARSARAALAAKSVQRRGSLAGGRSPQRTSTP